MDDWLLLAEGQVLVNIKYEASGRLQAEFGIRLAEVPNDEIRVDVMQIEPRPTGHYRVSANRKILLARQPSSDES